MTEPSPPSDESSDDRDDEAIRDLVKRSLATDVIAKDTPDILRGVQRRLRVRSRGKYFADGWSTSQARYAYVLIAVFTILLVALAYVMIGPVDVR